MLLLCGLQDTRQASDNSNVNPSVSTREVVAIVLLSPPDGDEGLVTHTTLSFERFSGRKDLDVAHSEPEGRSSNVGSGA